MIRPAVIGVGNVLAGDDGLGVRLVEDLRGEIEAAGADAIDGGTGGFALLGLVEGRPGVVCIDAARMGLAPGSVRVFGRESLPDGGGALSGHDLDLAATVGMLAATAPRVRVRIVGVEPGPAARGIGFSGEIRRRYGEVKEAVLAAVRAEISEVAHGG